MTDSEYGSEGMLTSQPPTIQSTDSLANKAFKLGSYLRSHHKFYSQSERSSIWMYNPKKGIWISNGANFIQNFLANYLGRMYSTHLVKEIQNYVRFIRSDRATLLQRNGLRLSFFRPTLKWRGEFRL